MNQSVITIWNPACRIPTRSLVGIAISMIGCAAHQAPRHIPKAIDPATLGQDTHTLIAQADRLVKSDTSSSPTLDKLDRADIALRRAAPQAPSQTAIAWRRARIAFMRAEKMDNQEQRVEIAGIGVEQAKLAISLDSDRVEPHYYLALNLAQIAEAKAKLSLIKKMAAHAERAAKINPAYDNAGPLVFLGKLYLAAPAWPVSIGDIDRAIAYLKRAIALTPRPITRFYLAQAYAENDNPNAAKREITDALKAPANIRSRRDRIWRQEARTLLSKLTETDNE